MVNQQPRVLSEKDQGSETKQEELNKSLTIIGYKYPYNILYLYI